MNARGSAFSCRLRAGVALRALAAGSAWAGDLRSGDNRGARIGTRYISRRLTAAFAALGLTVVAPSSPSHAQAPPLGTAASFGVLAGATVTNVPGTALIHTTINGDLGVSPGSACTGFDTVVVVGCSTLPLGFGHVTGAMHADSQKYAGTGRLRYTW